MPWGLPLVRTAVDRKMGVEGIKTFVTGDATDSSAWEKTLWQYSYLHKCHFFLCGHQSIHQGSGRKIETLYIMKE